MCTKEDNEQLMEALIAAARAAFLSLKETTKEHFYFYVFVFDEDKSWWKWDSADSPYAVYGYDKFFVKWVHCWSKGQVNYPMMNYMRLSGKCGLILWKRP